jgi:hypothetical protein
MKRTLIVLALLTVIVPAVANAQTINIRSGNNPALGQIVSSVIAGLTGRVPYQNQYYTPQIPRRSTASALSGAYQNGYAQGAADARRAPYNQYSSQYGQYGSQYGVNSGYQNRYRQNLGDRDDRFQPNVRGSWRGGY